MRRHDADAFEINEQDFEKYIENEKSKKKSAWGGFAKFLVVLLVLGFVGQSSYFAYTNRNLLFRSKVAPQTTVVTPKEQIVLTAYEQKTSASVKAFPTFVGSKSEALAVAQDFATKYLTMSNLKSQVDFLGSEYIYPNEITINNFKEYALTNYYYYFPDMLKTFGQTGLPEVASTEVLTTTEVSYIHKNVQKVPGYAYALANDLQQDTGFMEKKFKGYDISVAVGYPQAQQSLSWMQNAPTQMEMVILFDADSGKWFVSEFQTTRGSTSGSDGITVTNPSNIKN